MSGRELPWDGDAGFDGCSVQEPSEPCMWLARWDLRYRLQGICDSGTWKTPVGRGICVLHLGVPPGEIKVPYEVNNKIEEALFARLFPGTASMPNTTVLATSLEAMKTHGEVFKMKLLMYLISAVFAPTTSLRPSNKCFPILVNDISILFPTIFCFWCHAEASHCQFDIFIECRCGIFLSWILLCRWSWNLLKTWVGVNSLPTSCMMHSQLRCTRRVVACT